MTKPKKMPMGSDILLALYDARNRISAYDLAQADKIQGLIENQLDDMTPIVTSEPDWIRSVLQDEVRETSDLLAQPITFAPGVPQDEIPFRTALIETWSEQFATAAAGALETIDKYISMAGGDARCTVTN